MGRQAPRLNRGDHLRVVAPSRSLGMISPDNIAHARRRLAQQGYKTSFGAGVYERDEFDSSSPEARLTDLHAAFEDPSVNGVLSAIGGYNSNQIIDQVDYGLIAQNPKIVCGFSDITALLIAIYSQTGLITYLGPHFSSWAMRDGFEYTERQFNVCCAQSAPFEIPSSDSWSDDEWFVDQDARHFIPNGGLAALRFGEAEGRFIGGNILCVVTLLGTRFWPGLRDSILFLEAPGWINPSHFDQLLQALVLQADFNSVRALVFGRFQKKANMSIERLSRLLDSKPQLRDVPVLANADFGHTSPLCTLPIGGRGRVVSGPKSSIWVEGS